MPNINLTDVVAGFPPISLKAAVPDLIAPFKFRELTVAPEFPDSFEVPVLSYRKQELSLPQALKRISGLTEDLFPVPAHLNTLPNGEILDSEDITAVNNRATVTRMWSLVTAHALVTTGRIGT